MKNLFVASFALLLLACGTTRQTVPDETAEATPKQAYDESFDPHSIDDDDIIIARHEKGSEIKSTTDDKFSATPSPPIIRESEGFRVQLVATKSIESATMTQLEAQDLFATMNQKSYLVYEAPLYKVRVGDLLTREAAESIREIAREHGYREAFVVPSKVNIHVDDDN